MLERAYKVILYTPLGERNGMLELMISEAKINGYLNILQHKESVEGELNDDSTCKLRGKIVTLMSKFCYEAVGKMDCDSIDLTIHGGRSELKMKGIAVASGHQSQGGKS